MIYAYLFSGGLKCDCTGTGYAGATCSSSFYFPYGPQTNVNEEKVTSGGWTQCHSESMTVPQGQSSLDAIIRKCSKSKLIMGCRKSGSSTITLLAAAPNGKEALKVTGDNGQIINGSKWYRKNGKSYGFAHKTSRIVQVAADSSTTRPELRLSYHLCGGTYGGWRCGSATMLDNDSTWERLYYHAN